MWIIWWVGIVNFSKNLLIQGSREPVKNSLWEELNSLFSLCRGHPVSSLTYTQFVNGSFFFCFHNSLSDNGFNCASKCYYIVTKEMEMISFCSQEKDVLTETSFFLQFHIEVALTTIAFYCMNKIQLFMGLFPFFKLHRKRPLITGCLTVQCSVQQLVW